MAAPKQPQDHKISAAEADALKAPFGFTGVDGKAYEIPHFSPTEAGLTGGDLRKNRGNQEEIVFRILEALVDDETMGALDELPAKDYGEVLNGWQRAGAELPKS